MTSVFGVTHRALRIVGRHTPRKRGIQYAAASRFYYQCLGILDRPAKPGDDCCVRSLSHATFAFASSMARQTRSGVSGISICAMPYSESASTTALTMVERLPAQPASPQPLVPSGLDLAGTG